MCASFPTSVNTEREKGIDKTGIQNEEADFKRYVLGYSAISRKWKIIKSHTKIQY